MTVHSGRGKMVFSILLLLLAVPALSLGENPKLAERGFVPLFDGRSLSGWKTVNGTGSWSATDGSLRCEGIGKAWLRSEKVYANFILRLDYAIGKGGNSGVFIRVPEEGRSSRIGFEIQILDDAGQPPHKGSTGSLYDILAPSENRSRPAGEWNELEIAARGRRVTITLNGARIVEANLDDPTANASLDDDHKMSRRRRTGYIGLQDHGALVRFRNIRIRELP